MKLLKYVKCMWKNPYNLWIKKISLKFYSSNVVVVVVSSSLIIIQYEYWRFKLDYIIVINQHSTSRVLRGYIRMLSNMRNIKS